MRAPPLRRGQLAPDWEAADCETESGTTRVYLGADGVMVGAPQMSQGASLFASRNAAGSRVVAVLLNFEPDVHLDATIDVGSCGKVVYALIQMLFPGDALGGLATAARERAHHFSTELQGRLTARAETRVSWLRWNSSRAPSFFWTTRRADSTRSYVV